MYNITISRKTITEIYELIGTLKRKNISFSFTYNRPTNSNYERTAVFHFDDKKIALWFNMVFKD